MATSTLNWTSLSLADLLYTLRTQPQLSDSSSHTKPELIQLLTTTDLSNLYVTPSILKSLHLTPQLATETYHMIFDPTLDIFSDPSATPLSPSKLDFDLDPTTPESRPRARPPPRRRISFPFCHRSPNGPQRDSSVSGDSLSLLTRTQSFVATPKMKTHAHDGLAHVTHVHLKKNRNLNLNPNLNLASPTRCSPTDSPVIIKRKRFQRTGGTGGGVFSPSSPPIGTTITTRPTTRRLGHLLDNESTSSVDVSQSPGTGTGTGTTISTVRFGSMGGTMNSRTGSYSIWGTFFNDVEKKFVSLLMGIAPLPILSKKCDRVVLPLLEILSFAMFALYCAIGIGTTSMSVSVSSSDGNAGFILGWIVKGITFLADPMQIVGSDDLVSFTIVFVVTGVFVLLSLLLFGYFFFAEFVRSNSIAVNVVMLLMRLLRTVFFFPVGRILLSASHMDFFVSSSLVPYRLSLLGYSVVKLPLYLFVVFGIIGVAVVVGLSVLDSLFLLDKFRVEVAVWELSTAAPDGLFPFLLTIGRALMLIVFVFVPPELDYVRFSIGLAISGILLLYVVRYTPYYASWMTFSAAFFLSLATAFGICSVVSFVVGSYWTLWTLVSILVVPILSFTLIILRYSLIQCTLRSKALSLHRPPAIFALFVLGDPVDVSIMLSRLESAERMDSLLAVLRNPGIRKSEALCHMLISLSLENPLITCSILNHARTIRGNFWRHHELALEFYRDKIARLRFSGSVDKDPFVSRLLSSLRGRESRLKLLYRHLLASVLSEVSEIVTPESVNLSVLLSEISSIRCSCERIYGKLLEEHATEDVLLQYARYARVFLNDAHLSDTCHQEASLIRHIPRSNFSDSELGAGRSVSGLHTVDDDPTERLSFGTIENAKKRRPDIRRSLRARIRRIRCSAANCLQASYFLFLMFVVVVFVGCFVTVLVAQVRMKKSSKRIYDIADLRLLSTSSAHFLRKLQVGSYSESQTPFLDERNTSYFRSMTRSKGEVLLETLKTVYEDSRSVESMWQSPVWVLLGREDNESSTEDYRFVGRHLKLIDALHSYGEKTLRIAELSDQACGSRVVGSRLEDNADFIYVTLNEPAMHDSLQSIHDALWEQDVAFSRTISILMTSLPLALLFFIPLFLVGYLWFKCASRSSLDGLRLISQDFFRELYSSFGGKVNEIGSRQVQMQRCENVDRTIVFLIFVVVLSVLVLSIFSVVAWMEGRKFVTRSFYYDRTLSLPIRSHRVHLWTVELLYRDDTLFLDEVVGEGLKFDMNEIDVVFSDLRFGAVGCPGNDREEGPHLIYYHPRCSSVEGIAGLCCRSLSSQIVSLVNVGNELLWSNSSNLLLRNSSAYRTVIELDDKSTGRGCLHQNVARLTEEIQRTSTTGFDIAQCCAVLTFVLGMISVLGCAVGSLWDPVRQLENDLLQVKEFLMLLPRKVILERHVFDFLVGRDKLRSLKKRQKSHERRQLISMLSRASYSLIWFDAKMRLLSWSDQADELLSLRESSDSNFGTFLISKDLQTVQEWMKNKYTPDYDPFVGEVFVRSSKDFEFRVFINILRDSNSFVAILEDVETANKKKILEEAERMSSKTEELLLNILPAQIAEQMKTVSMAETIVLTHKAVTAWFTDICDFTRWCGVVSPQKLILTLNDLYARMDRISQENGMEKIKTIGDAYFAVCGVPKYRPLHAQIALDSAIAVFQELRVFNAENNLDFHLRMGLSSGPVTSGVIGKWKFQYDVYGSAINEAARMESHAPVDKIQVSRATFELVFDKYRFFERRVNFEDVGVVKCYVHSPDGSALVESPPAIRLRRRETKEEEEGEDDGDDDVEEVEELFPAKDDEDCGDV